MLVVKLDNQHVGSGPATVVAQVDTVIDYLALAVDRDGVRDLSLRLWQGDFAIGTRVESKLLCGTGKGVTYREGECSSRYARS